MSNIYEAFTNTSIKVMSINTTDYLHAALISTCYFQSSTGNYINRYLVRDDSAELKIQESVYLMENDICGELRFFNELDVNL